jgi:hypothetical protein
MMTRWQGCLIIVILSWGAQLMATPIDKPTIAATNATVELDIYSGKPNPSWSLSKELIPDLLQRLRALEPSGTAPAEFDGLGYRGVRASLQDSSKLTASLIVSRGAVTIVRDGQQSWYRDAGRQLELWLVQSGASIVSSDVLQYVTREISRK